MTRIVGLIWSWALRWVITPAFWFLLIASTVTVVCLVVSHICLITDTECPSSVKNYTDWFLGMFTSNLEQLEEHKYSAIVSDIIFVLAFLVAISPLVQVVYFKIQYKRKYRREQGIESFEVKEKGKDDLETMLRYYKGAEHLTIFCGAFAWLRKNAEMRSLIVDFANDGKLKLVSYKSKTQVREAFSNVGEEELFEQLYQKQCFKFNSGLPDVKCSMIKRVGAELRFLFRQSSDQNPFNACVLSSTNQSRELLYILSKLTEAKHWGTPDGDSTCGEQG